MIESKQTMQKKPIETTSKRVDDLIVRLDTLEEKMGQMLDECKFLCESLRAEVNGVLSDQRDELMRVRGRVSADIQKKKSKCAEALQILIGE